MYGIGYAVIQARRQKLLKRLAATPMRRAHYLLAQLLARAAFLVVEVAAIVLFGRLLFSVRMQGSWLALGGLSLLGAASFAGLALSIAARVRSIEAAGGWMNAVIMPMWMLSGSLFSYERFPEAFHPIIRALPLTALNDGLRTVINEGGGLGAILPQMAVLTLWGVLGFTFALRSFRWQ